jgi:2-dehydropantoate 2-reductase
MKIAVLGLGAMGGLMAARLKRGGADVCALARGVTLAAVAERGLTLIERDGDGHDVTSTVRLPVSDDAAKLGPQDLVILSVKSNSLPGAVTGIAPLLGPDTAVLSAMNGVPWWFFHGMGGPAASLRVDSVDPDGRIASAVPAQRVIGAVLHLAASCPQPGVVRHAVGDRIIVGEPAGGPPSSSPRCQAAIDALAGAGFIAEPSSRIQFDIWYKLWGNMTMNPISAFTGATADRILDDDLVRAFMTRVMREAAAIGESIGLPIADTPEARHALTRKLGPFKTSMLQDVEAGRAVELDALVAAVAEIGRQVAVPTPDIDALLGLARLFARTRGLYPSA